MTPTIFILSKYKGILNIFHNHEGFSGRNGGTTGTGYARWRLDPDSTQGCDLPKIKDATYGFNQNTDVVATLPTSHWTNFSYLLNITVTPIPTVVIIFLRHSYNFF